MAFQQRGRLLVPIKTQVVPIGDLGLPIGGVGGLQFPDDLPPVLAVNTVQTPAGPRLIHGNAAGSIFARPSSVAALVNNVTYTASGTVALPDLTWVTALTIVVKVTAVSGTTPTLQAELQGSIDNGTTWVNISGLVNLTANGQVGVFVAGVGVGGVTANGIQTSGQYGGPLPPLCRLALNLGGTTPSFSVYAFLVTQ